MLQGHVFDSFLRTDQRGGGAFMVSQFLGGMPPAIFLFLTGVTLAFLMDSTWLPEMVRNYFVPDYRFFAFFPWAAYVAFGMSAGSIIRTVSSDSIERAMQWSAILGGAMILACQYFGNLPFSLYAKSEYWL